MTGQDQNCKNKQAGRNHAKWLTGKTDHSMNFKNSSQNFKNSFLAYASKWAFSKFLWFMSRAPQTVWQRQETYGSAVSSTTRLGLMWISLLPLLPFSTSLLHFYLRSPIPFCLSTSVEYHMGLWAEYKVITQPHDLLSVYEMNSKYSDHHQKTLKVTLHNNHDMRWYSQSHLYTKFVLYTVILNTMWWQQSELWCWGQATTATKINAFGTIKGGTDWNNLI